MATDAHEGKLLAVREVARQLDVSETTVRRWISSGSLPAVQLGGPGFSVRVDPAELRRWVYEEVT